MIINLIIITFIDSNDDKDYEKYDFLLKMHVGKNFDEYIYWRFLLILTSSSMLFFPHFLAKRVTVILINCKLKFQTVSVLFYTMDFRLKIGITRRLQDVQTQKMPSDYFVWEKKKMDKNGLKQQEVISLIVLTEQTTESFHEQSPCGQWSTDISSALICTLKYTS